MCALQYEAKARLESMSGSTSISSADLFGDGRERSGLCSVCVPRYHICGRAVTLMFASASIGSSGFDSVLPSGPDITQFKQGVKTVAGKMAVLANGVMNTIQVMVGQSESECSDANDPSLICLFLGC